MHKSNEKKQNRSVKAQKVLKRVFEHQPSEEIMDAVQDWMVNEGNQDVIEPPLRDIYDDMVFYEEIPRQELVEELPRLRSRLGLSSQRVMKIPLWRKPLFRVAAVLIPALLIVGASLVMLQKVDDSSMKLAVDQTTVSIGGDVQREVELPDGSRVLLGENSFIEYAEDFTSDRSVELKGEAYFSVAKMNGATFEVIAQGLKVRVLGTEFFINSAQQADKTEVTLTTGKVEVVTDRDDMVYHLSPQEQLVLDRMTNGVVTKVLTEEEFINVIDKGHFINTISLSEIFGRLSTVYGVKVAVDDNMPLDGKIKINIDGNVSLEDALFVIQKASDPTFDYEIKDNVLYINKR